jgi:hypothetical protein
MCLIAWNWQPDSATPLAGCTHIGGRDTHAGGTWLGVSRVNSVQFSEKVFGPEGAFGQASYRLPS